MGQTNHSSIFFFLPFLFELFVGNLAGKQGEGRREGQETQGRQRISIMDNGYRFRVKIYARKSLKKTKQKPSTKEKRKVKGVKKPTDKQDNFTASIMQYNVIFKRPW